jgi:hypothetical protein
MKAGYYINVLSHFRPADTEGQIGFVVEYMATTGPRKSGKVEVTMPAVTGGFLVKGMRTKIREAVAKALSVDPKTIVVMGD